MVGVDMGPHLGFCSEMGADRSYSDVSINPVKTFDAELSISSQLFGLCPGLCLRTRGNQGKRPERVAPHAM